MIVRTEYSFRSAFGSIESVLARLPDGGIIADEGTWGHVAFAEAAKKAGKPYGLGARFRLCANAETRSDWRDIIVVPTTPRGLRELYGLVRLAHTERFYYFPRLLPGDIAAGDWKIIAAPSKNGKAPPLPEGAVVPFVPGVYVGDALAFSDNYYPAPEDKKAWAFSLGDKAFYTPHAQHIMLPYELQAEGASSEVMTRGLDFLRSLDVAPAKAENIRFPGGDAMRLLVEQCRTELEKRGLGLSIEYNARLERELALVQEKGFADYFLVIADMIAWAKKRMLVGPGRGSSAGSIVCWLLRITEVDPIVHGLLFERFIDANRFDLPDIDIDFPDAGRYEVLDYLASKYGQENVAHIGTVMRFKPKSALTDVAKQLKIPDWELKSFKDVIVERSSGDARVNDCLRDTMESLPLGRELIKKYPDITVAFELEGRARQTGTHAAGMIVCNAPVDYFCSIGRERVAQIDKKAATSLNILKIDALGLRNLSILDDALALCGMDRQFLYDLALDDAETFKVFRDRRYTGIFQFEGYALQSLANVITVREFNDLAQLTALARPGPLGGGDYLKWIERHEGREPIVPPHPRLDALTRETYGIILYQEQVMTTTRELGGFSWKDTAAIRKLMSDRKGDESFRKFEKQFIDGAVANGVPPEDAAKIWKSINTFGSWAFNKSHAVVYGLISYWCGYMKAHRPLEFACACMRHSKGEDSAKLMLRELTRDGIPWVAFDADLSKEDWAVVDGKLVGGLTGIPGIGEKKAREIMIRKANGIGLTEHQQKMLARESIYANAFPTRRKFGHIYEDPRAHDIVRAPLKEIVDVGVEQVVVIGRLVKKNLRDANEDTLIAKRGGKKLDGPLAWLVFHIEDDTGRLIGIVDRFNYEELGAKIVENGVVGKTWLMVRGDVNEARFFNVRAVRWLE